MPPLARPLRATSADARSPLILTDVICARIMLRLGDIDEWQAVAKLPRRSDLAPGPVAMPVDASLVQRLLRDFGARTERADEIRAEAELRHVRNWTDGL